MSVGAERARRIAFACEHERYALAGEVRRVARAAGLSAVREAAVATVVAELATNAVRFARRAWLTVEPLARDGRAGVRLVVEDDGPGIADPASALLDGFSEGVMRVPGEGYSPPRRGLGTGLGAVSRLAGSVPAISRSGHGGARVEVEIWDDRGSDPKQRG